MLGAQTQIRMSAIMVDVIYRLDVVPLFPHALVPAEKKALYLYFPPRMSAHAHIHTVLTHTNMQEPESPVLYVLSVLV